MGVLLTEPVPVVVNVLIAFHSQTLWATVRFIIPLHVDEVGLDGRVQTVCLPDEGRVAVDGVNGSDLARGLLSGEHGVRVVGRRSHPPVDDGGDYVIDVEVAAEQVTLVELVRDRGGLPAFDQVADLVFGCQALEEIAGSVEPHRRQEIGEL